VTDIFSLEELPIREYLTKSRANIVLKSGSQWYGFHRKQLIDYLNAKTYFIIHIIITYETPFNQCIDTIMLQQFGYSDFSIYELTNAYSIPNGHQVLSLCHMDCYSIKNWIDNIKGKECKIEEPFSQPPVLRRYPQGHRHESNIVPYPPQIPIESDSDSEDEDEIPEFVIVNRGHPLAPQNPAIHAFMDALEEQRAVEDNLLLPEPPIEAIDPDISDMEGDAQEMSLREILTMSMNGLAGIQNIVLQNSLGHMEPEMIQRFQTAINQAQQELTNMIRRI
jgi:hypothetical protein